MFRSKKILMFLVLIFVFFLVSVSSLGETLNVCKSGCRYQSIQNAIYDSNTGDRISIEPGRYEENLEINRKELTLEGVKRGQVIVSGKDEGYEVPVFLIGPSGAEVTLKSITLGGPESNDFGDRIVATGNTSVEILNSVISGNPKLGDFNGISLKDNARAKISNSKIMDNSGNGIFLTDSASASIYGNVIKSNLGIGIISKTDKVVEGNNNVILKNNIGLVGNLPGGLRKKSNVGNRKKIILPDEQYPTLQKAIDALQPGGEILLEEGSFKGGVVVSKEITIESASGEVVVEREKPIAFSVIGKGDLSLSDVTVSATRPIVLANQGQAQVEDCVIEGVGDIKLYNSSRATISRSKISVLNIDLNESSKIEIIKSDTTGIQFENNSKGLISKSEITDSIQVHDTSKVTVKGTEVKEHDTLWLDGNSKARFENATLRGVSLSLYDSSKAIVVKSTISEVDPYGIELNDSSKVQLNKSTISNCKTGIVHIGSGRLTVIDSIITRNGVGLDSVTSAKTIIKNSLIAGNEVGIHLYGNNKSQMHLVKNKIVDNNIGFDHYAQDKLTGYGNQIMNKVDIDDTSGSALQTIKSLSNPDKERGSSDELDEDEGGKASKTNEQDIIYEQNFDKLRRSAHTITINQRNYMKANEVSDAGKLDDFILEVDVRESSGNPAGYGVIFRKSGKSKFYAFVLSNTGMYRLAKQTSDSWRWEILIDWTKSLHIKKRTQWNHLKLNANNSKVELYANGQLLQSVDDSSLERGSIALMATSSKSNPNVQVDFDNLVIYEQD